MVALLCRVFSFEGEGWARFPEGVSFPASGDERQLLFAAREERKPVKIYAVEEETVTAAGPLV